MEKEFSPVGPISDHSDPPLSKPNGTALHHHTIPNKDDCKQVTNAETTKTTSTTITYTCASNPTLTLSNAPKDFFRETPADQFLGRPLRRRPSLRDELPMSSSVESTGNAELNRRLIGEFLFQKKYNL